MSKIIVKNTCIKITDYEYQGTNSGDIGKRG